MSTGSSRAFSPTGALWAFVGRAGTLHCIVTIAWTDKLVVVTCSFYYYYYHFIRHK
jgi:hypothetical protein